MRFRCFTCQATFQPAASGPLPERLTCPACLGEMMPEADVVELRGDRDPTKRYDLDELRARLGAQKGMATDPSPTPPPRNPEQIWFVGILGREVGPLTPHGLEGLRTRGQLDGDTLVWREGFPTWVAADAVPELRDLLGLPARQPSPPPEPADGGPDLGARAGRDAITNIGRKPASPDSAFEVTTEPIEPSRSATPADPSPPTAAPAATASAPPTSTASPTTTANAGATAAPDGQPGPAPSSPVAAEARPARAPDAIQLAFGEPQEPPPEERTAPELSLPAALPAQPPPADGAAKTIEVVPAPQPVAAADVPPPSAPGLPPPAPRRPPPDATDPDLRPSRLRLPPHAAAALAAKKARPHRKLRGLRGGESGPGEQRPTPAAPKSAEIPSFGQREPATPQMRKVAAVLALVAAIVAAALLLQLGGDPPPPPPAARVP